MTPTVKSRTVGPAAFKQDISRMAAEQSQHKSFSSTLRLGKKQRNSYSKNCATFSSARGRSCGLLQVLTCIQ